MQTLSSVEAQNRFSQLLDAAQREPMGITRHGRLVTFIVSVQDMQDMQALQEARHMQTQARHSAHRQWADACADG